MYFGSYFVCGPTYFTVWSFLDMGVVLAGTTEFVLLQLPKDKFGGLEETLNWLLLVRLLRVVKATDFSRGLT